MDEEDELRQEIISIEGQLSARKAEIEEHKDEDGRVPQQDWAEFCRWRSKASHALRMKKEELGKLVRQRKNGNSRAMVKAREALENKDPEQIHEALYKLVCEISGQPWPTLAP
jgi:hypothetical protein